MSDRVIVVGAGLTGLTAAHELHRAGVPVTVLEAADRIGGRIATEPFADGAIAERCMEEMWECSPAMSVLRRLGLPLEQAQAHSSAVVVGRLHTFDATSGGTVFRAGARRTLAELDAAMDHDAAIAADGPLGELRRTSFAAYVGGFHLGRAA